MTVEPPTWGFTSGNPATVEMFRARSEQDFITYGPGHLSPERQPDGRASGEKAREMIEAALREGSHFFEWTHARVGGETFPATVLLTRLEYAGKVSLQATVRDITGQKQAESQRDASLEALRESESKFKAIACSAHNPILMMGPDGKISYWNRAAEDVLGYTSGEAAGQDLHELLAPRRYHEAHQAAFPEFKRTGQGTAVGKTVELEAIRKDGREISVELSLSSVQIKSAWHAIGILRDISERKRTEENLSRSRIALEEANARLEVRR